MKLYDIKIVPHSILIDILKTVHLRGDVDNKPYAKKKIYRQYFLYPSCLEGSGTCILPTQTYLLKTVLDAQESVLEQLSLWKASEEIRQFGVFGRGGYTFFVDEDRKDKRIFMPPVVERHNNEFIMADGAHRIVTMYNRFGIDATKIPVFVVDQPSEPYYAIPHQRSWEGIDTLDKRPAQELRKEYREPETPKRLYRDYNSAFMAALGCGVQPDRSKL